MKTLNKQMSEMIKECCGLTLTATLDQNFWVSKSHKKIAYSLQCDKCDKDFCSFVKKNWKYDFQPATIDLMILSILHEVGHLKTFKYFSDTNTMWNMICKIGIDKLPKPLYHVANKLYFNLPLEKAATAWAIWFYKMHPDKIKTFKQELNTNVQAFYKRLTASTK